MYFSYYKRAFYIKAQKYRRFGNDIVQSVSVVFHGAFRWLFLFTIKNHLCANDYAATVCAITHAIKTRSNNPLRFLQRKNSIRRYLANDLTCAVRKTTFRTRNVFTTNNTRPNQKINHLNQSALIFTLGLTKATLQSPSDHNFSSFSQNHNRSIKNNQPEQSIKSNNQKKQSTQSLNQNTLKTKHNKQTRKTISSINRKIYHKNNHNKQQSTQPLDKKHPKTTTTSSYEKMQYF